MAGEPDECNAGTPPPATARDTSRLAPGRRDEGLETRDVHSDRSISQRGSLNEMQLANSDTRG